MNAISPMYVRNEKPNYFPSSNLGIEILNVKQYVPHRHDEAMEFVYCLSGSAEFTIAHEIMALREGELVLIEHENVHAISSNEDNVLFIVHINLKDCKFEWEEIKYMYFSCATALARSHQQEELERIYEVLLAIAYVYVSQEEKSFSIYEKLVDKLLDLTVNGFSWFAIEDFSPEENEKYKDRLNRALKFAQIHFKDKITLSQIAGDEYINPSYYSQFLKRTSFHSFTFMLNYVRCFEAEKLLLGTDLSIQEISDSCGFSSKKYFHKYFKLYWNITPFQYRKYIREQLNKPNNYEKCESKGMLPLVQDRVCKYLTGKLLK